MTRILIVDDHELLREGLRAILEKDPTLEVIGEADDGQEAVHQVRETAPDVVLMDISLPGGLGGLEATEAILGEHPNVKVLILTQYENPEYIRRAIRIGAHGYLLKRSASAELKDAIRTVEAGRRYLHPRVSEELIDLVASGRGLEEEDPYESLTRRERQVFKLLAEGKTSREIAKYLGISPKTAMTHRSHVMEKLDLHSRSELIRYAIRKNVIEVEPG